MEVLRLYPPFRNFGYSSSNQPETHLVLDLMALHRSELEWEMPETFHPDRFISPGSAGGFKYLPFGMGKRACPARSFATRFLVSFMKSLLTSLDKNRCVLALPNDYQLNNHGLPIYTKKSDVFSGLADTRITIESEKTLAPLKIQLTTQLVSRINSLRTAWSSPFVEGELLRERRLEEAAEYLAQPQMGPGPLLHCFASTRSIDPQQAANRIIRSAQQHEAMLLETEFFKEQMRSLIASATSTRQLRPLSPQIENYAPNFVHADLEMENK